MNQNLHNARTSPVRKKHYSTPHSPLSTQLSISPLTHSQSHNILGNALQRRFTLCSVGFMYICVWKCRYLGDSSDVDDVAESSRHPLPWLPLPLSPFSCLLSTSFAFNHVERREKRRLVFAKSFNACESRAQEQREGLLLVWVWSGLGCLSLIINNENDGVKSCRCAMPNAGISFMVQARLGSSLRFKGLRPGRAEHGVKYLLMGTRQVVETHSHLVIWPGAISYAIVCTSKSANCTTAPPMGMLCVLVWVLSVSRELCECASLALSVRIAIVSGVSKWSPLLLLYIPDTQGI